MCVLILCFIGIAGALTADCAENYTSIRLEASSSIPKDSKLNWLIKGRHATSATERVKYYGKARKICIQDLKATIKKFGSNSIEVAWAKSNLAFIQYVLQEYDKSKKNCLDVLKILKKHNSSDADLWCVAYLNLGRCNWKTKDIKKAQLFLSKSLKWANKTNKPANICKVYSAFGCLYYSMKKYGIAVSYSKKALDRSANLSAWEMKNLKGNYYDSLAQIATEQKKYDEALKYFLKEEQLFSDSIAKYCPLPETLYSNIITCCWETDNIKQGKKYSLKAIEYNTGKYGNSSLNVAIAYKELAKFYRLEKNYQQALHFFRKSANIYLNNKTLDRFYLGKTYLGMAITYQKMKRNVEALKFAKLARSLLHKKLGSSHPLIKRLDKEFKLDNFTDHPISKPD